MGVQFVRVPSETPNIYNTTDFVTFRYAYGGKNGYVLNKGRELEPTAIGTQFTIGSGRFVVDGVESDIDSNGFLITVDNISETRYYTVYAVVNLTNNTTTITSKYSTTDYPVIEKGDDLSSVPEGIANIELFNFTATSGVISNVKKLIPPINYIDQYIEDINKRLLEKGFSEDNITDSQGNVVGYVKRQGSCVIGSITNFNWTGTLVLPVNFRPKNDVYFATLGFIHVSGSGYGLSTIRASNTGGVISHIRISTNGTISVLGHGTYANNTVNSGFINISAETVPSSCNFGFEASPISNGYNLNMIYYGGSEELNGLVQYKKNNETDFSDFTYKDYGNDILLTGVYKIKIRKSAHYLENTVLVQSSSGTSFEEKTLQDNQEVEIELTEDSVIAIIVS